MRRPWLAACTAALFTAGPVLAQGTGVVAGRVTGADDGRAVANARVSASGTTVATISQPDGSYRLSLQPGTYTIVARRLGYMPDSVTGVVVSAGGTATANFGLRPAPSVLGEVVVTVPYSSGSQSGKEQTGAVASVMPKDFNTGRIVSPEQLITAKVPGVQVVDNNEPGGGISVRVRGGTSINASNEPLYVVDGVPLTVGGGTSDGRNPLAFINPQDIENITVLKDASSTAIYGNRGANGVVLITTRSGATGPQFSYTGTVSGSNAVGGPDMLDGDQYRAAMQAHGGAVNDTILGSANTDWLGAIERQGVGMEHDVGINGHRQDALYHIGLNYLDQQGILKGTRTQRLATTLNYSDRLLQSRLAVRAHIKGSRIKDAFTPGSVLGDAIGSTPTEPIYNPDGTYFQWNGNTLGVNNPIQELNRIQDRGTTLRSVGSLEGEYTLPWIQGLTATLRGSYDVIRADRTTFTPSDVQSQVESAPSNPERRGYFNRNLPSQLNTILDAYGRYEHVFNALESTMDLTGGYSEERFRGDYQSFYAQGLSTDLLGLNGVPTAYETRPFYNIDEYMLRSGFGRLNWTWRDRYLLTATVRRDGSSKFAKGHQYGTFPSVGLAWRAGDERFVKDHTPFSDLKLRLSWGVNGNQAVGNYVAYTSYTVGQSTAEAQFGNDFVTTIRPSASNPDLRWEQTKSTDFGIDYGFLDNRINGSLDLYTKRTTDLLFTVPTAAGTALSNYVTSNIGTVQNRGVELSVNAAIVDHGDRGFGWDASFTASTNRNELVSLNRPGLTSILVGGVSGGVGTTVEVLMPGEPVNSFYLWQHKEVNGKPVPDGPGVTLLDMYVDQNKDGVINGDDLRPFHDPAPKWILGHTSTFRWRGFDASTTLRAYLGNYVYNNVASNFGHYSVLDQSLAPYALHASVLENGFYTQQYLSDVYVENASFLRMDNLSIGYTFAKLAGLQRARVFGTVQNVFTTTKYTGVDPTAGVNGIDNTIYPRSRTFVGGLTVSF